LLFEEFNLDIQDEGRGVYIVDFVGNVKSCRMIIRKGSLKHITKDSTEGTLFYVLDENNEVNI
jgi:hypothetical protein